MSSGIPLRNPEHSCWQTYWLLTELCYSSVHWTPINIWNLVEISSPFGVQIVREQHSKWKKGILFQVLNSLKVCVWFCYNSWHVQGALSTGVSCSYCDVMFGLPGECSSCKNDTFGEFCTLHPLSFALCIHQVLLHGASTKLFILVLTKFCNWHPPSYAHCCIHKLCTSHSQSSELGIHQVLTLASSSL